MGYSESYAEFVSPASKGENLWVVMMDSLGNVLWEKIYPGSIGTNFGYSIKKYDNSSIVIAGADYKNDMDCRIVKINSDGVLLWDAHYGGSSEDYALSLSVTNQKDIIVAGYTSSNDGDVSNNKGGKDAWVVKLQVNDSLFTSVYEQFKLPIIVPNPSSTQFSITVDIETEDTYTIQLVSIDGSIVETVFSGLLPKGTKEIAVSNSNLQSGTYFCVVKNTKKMITQKFQIVK